MYKSEFNNALPSFYKAVTNPAQKKRMTDGHPLQIITKI